MQNIGKRKLLSDIEIGEIVGAGRAKDAVEALNEESDKVDSDLGVATEEEENRVYFTEVCLSVE